MSKNKGVAAVLAVNAVVLGVIALNAYRPKLEKYAKSYVEQKKKPKPNNYKLEQKKILQLAEKEIPAPDKLIEEALTKCELLSLQNNRIINPEVTKFLTKEFENFSLPVNNSGAIAIPMNSINIPSTVNIFPTLETKNKRALTFEEIPATSPYVLPGPVTQTKENTILKEFVTKLALMITLNTIGFASITTTIANTNISAETIEETIDDIEEFFIDTYDVVVTLNDHDKIVTRKIDRIMESEEDNFTKLINIYNLEELSKQEKIDNIIGLTNIDYKTKFDFFINPNYFGLDEGINLIIGSNIASFKDVADYIMEIDRLTEEEKVKYIINSDLTGYIRIFDYILSSEKINDASKLEYILNSNLAEYDELFDYFMKKDFSNYDKVWTLMQIKDVSFEKLFNDLLEDGTISQDEIISSVMKTDLISFKKLFKSILKIEDITSEEISNYLIYFNKFYNTGYNTISEKEIIDYTLSIKSMNEEDKVECFWTYLEDKTLLEKESFILNYYNTDIKGYLNTYIASLKTKEEIPESTKILIDLYQRINAEKLEFILTNYGTTEEELRIVTAGCAAEGYKDYDDLYGVINTIYNRITHPWYRKKGINPYLQLISPGQFSVYTFGSYLKYLYPKSEYQKEQYIRAEQAVLDMLYSGNTIHDYIEFRSWGTTDFSNNYIVKYGNRYGKRISDDARIELDFIEERKESEETQKELKLNNNNKPEFI